MKATKAMRILTVVGTVLLALPIGFMSLGVTIKILVFAGLSISSGILVFLFIALFCPELADHLGNKIKAFLIRINKDKAAEGVAGQIEEYRRGSEYIKAHKSLLLKTVATTLVQMLALYSITYFVYCALGGTAVSWFTMNFRSLWLLAALAAGVIVGVIFVMRGIKNLMIRHRTSTLFAVLGMMTGSLYAIVIGPTTLASPRPMMGLSDFDLVFFIVGCALVLGLAATKKWLKGKTEA